MDKLTENNCEIADLPIETLFFMDKDLIKKKISDMSLDQLLELYVVQIQSII